MENTKSNAEFTIFDLPQIQSHLRMQLHNFISFTKILKNLDKLCSKYKIFSQRQFLLNHYSDEVIFWISGLSRKINNLIFGEVDKLFGMFLDGFYGEEEKREFEGEFRKMKERVFEDNLGFGFESKQEVLGKEFKRGFIKKIENLIYTILIKNQPYEEKGKDNLRTLETVLRKKIEREIGNIEIVDSRRKNSLSLRYKSATPKKKTRKISKIVKVHENKQEFVFLDWCQNVKIHLEELPAPSLDLHGIVSHSQPNLHQEFRVYRELIHAHNKRRVEPAAEVPLQRRKQAQEQHHQPSFPTHPVILHPKKRHTCSK